MKVCDDANTERSKLQLMTTGRDEYRKLLKTAQEEIDRLKLSLKTEIALWEKVVLRKHQTIIAARGEIDRLRKQLKCDHFCPVCSKK